VRPGQSIEEEVSAFYAKVSSPLLADLDLDFGEVHVEDTYPYPLPDLFAGTQLVLVGRYRQGGFTTVTLEGEVNDRPQRFAYEDIHFRDRGGESFIPRLWATRKIGYLLSQIRLHGESKELVDEIVSLSVRYGIITPYTSFLVEETEKALTDAGREIIVEKEVQVMATPAPAFGAGAVEKSIAQESLRGADTVSAPTTAEVKHVSDKSFVLRDGVWTDTLYEPDRMETVKVGFGSDGYFDLLSARPAWGKYFALGQHVIVVLEGRAYEVTEGDYEVPERSSVVPSPAPTRTVRSTEPTLTVRSPEPTPTAESPESTSTVTPTSAKSPGKSICPGAALSAMLPLLGLALAWRRR
jgi:Ca-activated chloride channel family protein